MNAILLPFNLFNLSVEKLLFLYLEEKLFIGINRTINGKEYYISLLLLQDHLG